MKFETNMNNYTVNVTFHNLEVETYYCKESESTKIVNLFKKMPFLRFQYYKSVNGVCVEC